MTTSQKSAQRRVLFVVSAADHWTLKDGSRHPTGFWAEELAVPHQAFREAGWDVTIATPGGRAPTLDRLSMHWTAGTLRKRLRIADYLLSIKSELFHPVSLDAVDGEDFDLVFYPGGHGPMEDLAADPVSGALLSRRMAQGKPVAMLCHAPAAALAARGEDGHWPFAGYRMTGLSNVEERFNTFSWKAKWLLQDRLQASGAHYLKGLIPMTSFVVVDRKVYTGQNPASSERLARRLIEDLG